MKNIQRNLLPIFILICLVMGCKQFNDLVKENPNNENDTRPKVSERDPFEIKVDEDKEEIRELSIEKEIDGFPIPSGAEITSDKKNDDNPFDWKRRIVFTNSASTTSVAKFLIDELIKDGWKGNDRNRVGKIITNLDFENDSEKLRINIKRKSEGSSTLIINSDKFPMPPRASGGNRVSINGKLTLTTNVPENKDEVAKFYEETLSSQGWKSSKPINSDGTMILNFSRKNQKVMIMLSGSGDSTSVEIRM